MTGGIVANSIYLRPAWARRVRSLDVRRARRRDRARARLAGGDRGRRRAAIPRQLPDAHRPYATGRPDDRARARLDELIDQVMVEGQSRGRWDEVRALHQKAATQLDLEIGRFLHDLRQMGSSRTRS